MLSEFPMITELSTLSPIPNFRTWFLEKTKQGNCNLFQIVIKFINVNITI